MPTPRPHARTRRAAAALVLACSTLASLAGCDPRQMMYFLQPWEPEIPAPGPKLDGKKVVVVTHAVSTTAGEYQTIDRDINREVVALLRKKAEKAEVVETDKVNDWVEAHPNWTDPMELAKAFEADMVIYLEVESFQVQHPGDIEVLQGAAKTHIMAHELAHPKNSKGKPIKDKPKEAEKIYDDYSDTEFPVRGPVQGISRGAFKSKFTKVVAAEISWHFVGHSPDDNIQDVSFGAR